VLETEWAFKLLPLSGPALELAAVISCLELDGFAATSKRQFLLLLTESRAATMRLGCTVVNDTFCLAPAGSAETSERLLLSLPAESQTSATELSFIALLCVQDVGGGGGGGGGGISSSMSDSLLLLQPAASPPTSSSHPTSVGKDGE